MSHPTLVLASTSEFRSALLSRLQIPFLTAAPDIDESPLPGEDARQTSLRLSIEKARAVSAAYPDSLIIGSDQVALLDNKQIGKPGTHENAVKQLQEMQGKTVIFYTALTLLNTRNGNIQTDVAINRVHYRKLSDELIESYLLKEKPYNCAGSAKSEGLGIALLQGIEGDDPNALIGLPLILLVDMLYKENVNLF